MCGPLVAQGACAIEDQGGLVCGGTGGGGGGGGGYLFRGHGGQRRGMVAGEKAIQKIASTVWNLVDGGWWMVVDCSKMLEELVHVRL